jgi:hypothetical protein
MSIARLFDCQTLPRASFGALPSSVSSWLWTARRRLAQAELDAGAQISILVAMTKRAADDNAADVSTTQFDDFSAARAGVRKLRLAPIAVALRFLSGLALVFAFVSAAAILALDAAHWLRPEISWKIKSALPLIGIGVSYASLQFTMPRTRAEFWFGLAASLAFILWGAEQFIHAPGIAALIDDVVVFLFVLDLSVVIRGRLRRGSRAD